MSEPVRRIPFSRDDEEAIGSLAVWMKIAAGVQVATGIAGGLSAIKTHNLLAPVTGILSILVGVWIFQAAGHFRTVAHTDEADQLHVVQGMDRLRQVFLLRGILVLLTVALVVVGVVLALIAMLFAVTAAGGSS